MKLTKKTFIIMISILVLLLAVKLIFFLKDGSNDTIESILLWTIFSGSFLVFFLFGFQYWNYLEELFLKYQEKFFFVIMVFVCEIAFLIDNNLEFNTIYFFSLALIATLLILFSLIIPKKISKFFDITLIIFYGLYMIAQDYYYSIFDDFFSFKEAGTIKEGLEFAEGTYHFSFLHLFIAIILVVTLTMYILHKETSHINLNKKTLKKIYILPVLMFLFVNLNAQYPVKSARLHLSDHYLYYTAFSKERFVSRFGTINLLFWDTASTLKPSFTTKRDIEYIDDYYSNNVKVHTDNEYTGLFEGKNLIFILAESFDSIVVSEELTPNIYKLKSEGLDFQNHYTPVYPRTTCDTEVILNTSIIPSIVDGPTCYIYNKNTYKYSLPNLFNNESYTTNAFHNNYKEFYTRHLVYEGFGYDNFYGMDELELSESDIRYDSIFLQESLPYSIKEDENFFSFMLTLSGHYPYERTNLAVDAHYDTVEDYYGDTVPGLIKRFIASNIELDIMVGDILDDLESKNILDDTVIILTNDHYPYALDQKEYEDYKNIEEDYQKNLGPLYIWANDIEHREITKLSSSFDILPTLINMFSLDSNYSFYVGNDIFSDDYQPIVYFKDFSIYDGFDHYPLSEIDLPENAELISRASKYYELCQKILKVNYFE